MDALVPAITGFLALLGVVITGILQNRNRKEARVLAAETRKEIAQEASQAKSAAEEAKTSVEMVRTSIEGWKELTKEAFAQIDRQRARSEKEMEWLTARHELCEKHRREDEKRIRDLEMLIAKGATGG